MPKYVYECLSCEVIFEHRHSMTEKLEKCIKCGSDEVEKRVSDFSLENKETPGSKETGSEVKKFIEETRKEIKGERDNLSSRIVK